MKKTVNIISLAFFITILLGSFSSDAQILFTNIDNDPDAPHESAALEVRAIDGGLLVPFVTLNYDEGEIAAMSIPGTPADGLIIFHDGSNSISKGLWYYDAELPGWYIYSNYQSEFTLELDNYAELYESNTLTNGSPYDLSNTHYAPWFTALSGLMGPEFYFIDDALVNTESGTALADQLQTIGVHAIYSINISTTVTSGTADNTITGKLYINDVPVAHIFFRHTFQNKNYPTNCFTCGLIELHTDDKLDFRFTCVTAEEKIRVEHLNLRLTKVGEF